MLQCPKCGRHFASEVKVCPEDGAPLSAEATLPAASVAGASMMGRVLDDKYRLDELLGEGGMGTVYRATHLLIDRPVAVKVLNPRLVADEATMERFRREARAAGRLRHTNAVAVTDFGETRDHVVYIVMELLEGVTLRDVLAHEAPLDPARAVSLVLQASAAVAEAHEAGIIHRDLKPGNIFVVQRPHAPHIVKVLDFGIAKLATESSDGTTNNTLTGTGVMIGTPRYMSPEQCDGGVLTPASDVYSLGVILYEMLTGVPPFTGSTPLAVALKHSSEPPRRPSELVPHLPPALEEVVLHALEKKPAARPADAAAFRRELYIVAERLGLEHTAGFSPPTLETLRDAGTETPSGRLVIDIERLRQARAAMQTMRTDALDAHATSEAAVVRTGGHAPLAAPKDKESTGSPEQSGSPGQTDSLGQTDSPRQTDSHRQSGSPEESVRSSAASSLNSPTSSLNSAASLNIAASSLNSAAASSLNQSEARDGASIVATEPAAHASAAQTAGRVSSQAPRAGSLSDGRSAPSLRLPARGGQGRLNSAWWRQPPLLIATLSAGVLAAIVGFAAWRAAQSGAASSAPNGASEAEEAMGRTLSSADITPRAPLVSKEPRSAAEFYERGAYYFSARDYDAAIRDYRRALEIQPAFPHARNRLGRALMMKGEFGAAAGEFRRAVEQQHGRFAAASYNLGYALQLQGNLAEALEAYREAVGNHDGHYPDAFYQMGIIHLRQRRDAEAAEAMRRAVEQNGGRDPDAYFGLGVALARQKDYAAAEDAFRQAIEQRGGDFADAHFNLALVYQNTERYAEAVNEFETYLRQQPKGENRRLAENSIRDLRRRAAQTGQMQPQQP